VLRVVHTGAGRRPTGTVAGHGRTRGSQHDDQRSTAYPDIDHRAASWNGSRNDRGHVDIDVDDVDDVDVAPPDRLGRVR
jgi:hypothetical protein